MQITKAERKWYTCFMFHKIILSVSLNKVKGYFHKGIGVTNLEYTKGDSRKIIDIMYYKPELLYLNRKYNKIKNALEVDLKYGLIPLQKQRLPR